MNVVNLTGGFHSTLITQGLWDSVYMFVMGMQPKTTKLFFLPLFPIIKMKTGTYIVLSLHIYYGIISEVLLNLNPLLTNVPLDVC